MTNGTLILILLCVLLAMFGFFSYLCWKWMRLAEKRVDDYLEKAGARDSSEGHFIDNLATSVATLQRQQYENNSFIRVVDRRVMRLENPLGSNLDSDVPPHTQEPTVPQPSTPSNATPRHEREVIP